MTQPTPIIYPRVKRIVAEHAGSLCAIKPESRLYEDLKLDWMHLVSITNDLEDEFHVPIPDCELVDHLVTVSDLMTLVEMALEAAAEAAQAARRVA